MKDIAVKTIVLKGKMNSATSLVKSWHEAHNLLTEQVRLIETSQGLHEISYMFYLMMIATFNIFLTLSPIFRGEFPNRLGLIFNVIHFFAGMIRIYLKCHYAEQIMNEEKLLVDALFSWRVSCVLPEVRFTRSFL